MVDHMVPGRAATLRRPTRKELAATQVLAVALWEASLKVRTGGPDDEDDDVADTRGAATSRCTGWPARPSRTRARAGRLPDDVRRRAERAGRSLGSLHYGTHPGPVKPDGVRRGLTGEVIRRIEAKGYRLVRLELREATPELLAEHYAEHEGKPFYEPLVEFMLSGPVAAMVVEGERVIEGFRSLAGATDPTVAAPGTIRGDLGRDWGLAVQQNIVHGSDSPESAEPARSRSGSPLCSSRAARRGVPPSVLTCALSLGSGSAAVRLFMPLAQPSPVRRQTRQHAWQAA